jgi:hypothetical protein
MRQKAKEISAMPNEVKLSSTASSQSGIPNAEEAHALGALLDKMGEWPMTAAQRAVAIVRAWDAIETHRGGQ